MFNRKTHLQTFWTVQIMSSQLCEFSSRRNQNLLSYPRGPDCFELEVLKVQWSKSPPPPNHECLDSASGALNLKLLEGSRLSWTQKTRSMKIRTLRLDALHTIQPWSCKRWFWNRSTENAHPSRFLFVSLCHFGTSPSINFRQKFEAHQEFISHRPSNNKLVKFGASLHALYCPRRQTPGRNGIFCWCRCFRTMMCSPPINSGPRRSVPTTTFSLSRSAPSLPLDSPKENTKENWKHI